MERCHVLHHSGMGRIFEGLREDCRDSCEEGSLNGDTLVWHLQTSPTG